jgi:hypothetical protein
LYVWRTLRQLAAPRNETGEGQVCNPWPAKEAHMALRRVIHVGVDSALYKRRLN